MDMSVAFLSFPSPPTPRNRGALQTAIDVRALMQRVRPGGAMMAKKKPSKARRQTSVERTTRKRKPKKVEPLLDDRPGLRSKTVEELAAEQGVKPIDDYEEFLREAKKVWPKGESVDDFIAAVRSWRHGEKS
jgi:hypothetical protein